MCLLIFNQFPYYTIFILSSSSFSLSYPAIICPPSQNMSSKSAPSSSRDPSICCCGLPARKLTSWTIENPGRQFYNCKFRNSKNSIGCRHFHWIDNPKSEWQRKVINDMLLEKKLFNCELEILRAENEHMKEQSMRVNEEVKLLRLKANTGDNESEISIDKPNPKNGISKTLYVIVFVCIVAYIFKIVGSF